MLYTLMHKNTEVADIEMNHGYIEKIVEVHNKAHLPIGVVHDQRHKEITDCYALDNWWARRLIPDSRPMIQSALAKLNVFSIRDLSMLGNGLSLTDCYWIKPKCSDLEWKDINFHDNGFSEDVGDALVGTVKSNVIDYRSPDITTDGYLRKRWKLIDGRPFLMKNEIYESVTEMIVSKIAKQLGIDCVNYEYMKDGYLPYSVCECFTSPTAELVTAYQIMQLRPKENHENDYLHYVNICKEQGVDIVPALDKMTTLDYIIANEDRHFGNFGLLRDPDTLEWLGAAPIYDNGTSLWSTSPMNSLNDEIRCRPFKKTHGEQLGLVTSFDWLDGDMLESAKQTACELLSGELAKKRMGEQKCELVAKALCQRIDRLSEIVMLQTETEDMGMKYE